jgi:hypothetical protein
MWQVGSNVLEEPAASIFGVEKSQNESSIKKKTSNYINAAKIL